MCVRVCLPVFSSTGRSASRLRVGRERERQWSSVVCEWIGGVLPPQRRECLEVFLVNPVEAPSPTCAGDFWICGGFLPPQSGGVLRCLCGPGPSCFLELLFVFFSLIGLFLFIMTDFCSHTSVGVSPFPGDVYPFCSPLPLVPTSGGNKIIRKNRCFVLFFLNQHLTYSIDPYQEQALYVVTPGREA